MNVRRARAADLEAAALLWYERMALLRESDAGIELAPDSIERWRNQAWHWLNDAEFGFFVVEMEAQIVGLAVATVKAGSPGHDPDCKGVLLELAIDLHQAHSGLGGLMIGRVTSWLRSRHATVLDIESPANYPVEDAFWRAQGVALRARQYRLRL